MYADRFVASCTASVALRQESSHLSQVIANRPCSLFQSVVQYSHCIAEVIALSGTESDKLCVERDDTDRSCLDAFLDAVRAPDAEYSMLSAHVTASLETDLNSVSVTAQKLAVFFSFAYGRNREARFRPTFGYGRNYDKVPA